MGSLPKSGELRGTTPMIICRTHMVHMSLPYDTYSPPYDTYKRVYYLMSGSKQQYVDFQLRIRALTYAIPRILNQTSRPLDDLPNSQSFIPAVASRKKTTSPSPSVIFSFGSSVLQLHVQSTYRCKISRSGQVKADHLGVFDQFQSLIALHP